MTAMLSNPERERLAKLFGMLGSAHEGERDAAGLAAHRLVTASGVTWASVVCIPQDHPSHRDRADSADPFGGRGTLCATSVSNRVRRAQH
jgi:hypothetical protein